MAVKTIYGETYQFAIGLVELLLLGGEGHKLGGTDRGKVGRVTKKYTPASFIIGWVMNVSLGGFGFEFGCLVANTWHACYLNLFFHFNCWFLND